MDRLSTYIHFARLLVVRDRERDRVIMAFEIKGLGGLVSEVRKGIADVRAISAEANESARGLAGDLRDLKKQIDAHREDLAFEAQTLGNSQAAGEKLLPQSGGNGAATTAGEPDGSAPPDPALPSPERASGPGAVNRLDRNGVNKVDGDGSPSAMTRDA